MIFHPGKWLPSAAATLLSIPLLSVTPCAQAQWIVHDPAALIEAIIHEFNQLDQIALQNAQVLQQLKDYRLQLQNLQQLPGNVRNGVKDNLTRQLLNNVKDYGRSVLNKTSTQDPNSDSYYVVAEDLLSTSIGTVPRTVESTDLDLIALGMPQGRDSSIGQGVYNDRHQYDRVLDDLRQVALTRKNSSDRAVQANAITEQMAGLSDNNTVGAIQLLSAQNALAYGQQEDLIKNQTALLKNMNEEQARVLAAREEQRRRELARLARVRADTRPSTPTGNQ
jgi:P-type conjugative transfer protein TrbJ